MFTTVPAMSESISIPTIDSRAGKYLVFDLGGDLFAVRVQNIQEVMGMAMAGAIGGVPEVVNLRGMTVPVMDLRAEFGFPSVEYTERTPILIAQVEGIPPIGVVVDHIVEVICLTGDEVSAIPNDRSDIPMKYLCGMSNANGWPQMLLDIKRLLRDFHSRRLRSSLRH